MVPPTSLKDYRLAREAGRDHQPRHQGHCRASSIRYHICWGSWPGPHASDVPFKDIADLVLKVRAGAYSIELANPRHEHEWRLWENLKLPKDTVLIPGVISHATNIVEHPELVAERIVRLGPTGGARERDRKHRLRFRAGDHFARVHPQIMWAKLEALVRGRRSRQQASRPSPPKPPQTPPHQSNAPPSPPPPPPPPRSSPFSVPHTPLLPPEVRPQ